MAVRSVLPVALDLPDHLARDVTAWAESEAGWQIVALDGPPVPALTLAGAARPQRRCVVVVDGEPAADDIRAGLRAGALDVVGWPLQRDRLLEAAAAVLQTTAQVRGPRMFRIGGAAGGAGTSTVTLAVGGLLAWSGMRTVVIGDDDLVLLAGDEPWEGPGAVEVAALRPADVAAELPGVLRPVAGVDRLAVLGGGGTAVGQTAGWPADVVVLDARTHLAPWELDLVVVRPDRSLRAAQDGGTPALVCRGGPLDRSAVTRRLGRAPVGWLPESARVAKAGVVGRVPSSLPGTWIKALRHALEQVRPTIGGR